MHTQASVVMFLPWVFLASHSIAPLVYMSSSVIELPPNYGVNFIELVKRQSGKLGQYLLGVLFAAPTLIDRVWFRAKLDPVEPILPPKPCTVSCDRWTAVSVLNQDTGVTLLETRTPFARVQLEFSSVVTTVAFVHSRGVLLVGLLSGEIEVYNVVSPIEIKAVYKAHLKDTFPIQAVSVHNSATFEVILGKGKCALEFDLIATISGNTQVDPMIVDLIQNDVVSCDVLKISRLLASVSPNGYTVVTDLDSHTCINFNCLSLGSSKQQSNIVKCAWDQTNGHLLLIDESGNLINCSWSNGLSGVASVPTADTVSSGSRPSTCQYVTGVEQVDPNMIDLKNGILATIVKNELIVYKDAASKAAAPNLSISPRALTFGLVKRMQLGTDEQACGVSILNANRIASIFPGASQKYRVAFTDI